jgi:hypothetical protein
MAGRGAIKQAVKKSGAAPFTAEHMVWLRAWMKANADGEVVLKVGSLEEAKRIQHALYRTARIILNREDLQREYPQFLVARMNVSVTIREVPTDIAAKQREVYMYRLDKSADMQNIIGQLGLSNDDLKVPEGAGLAASMAKVQAGLSADADTGGEDDDDGRVEDARKSLTCKTSIPEAFRFED